MKYSFSIILLFFAMIIHAQITDKDMVEAPIPINFDSFPTYSGTDLGLTYSKKKCAFKIWSPMASEVRLHLYKKDSDEKPYTSEKMEKGPNGEWSAKIKGKLEGRYYTFQVRIDTSWQKESPDPYAIAAGVNGKKAQVVDLKNTKPEGWDNDKRPPLKSFNDIVLYELHIRDISIHPNSGINNKGKFLGLAETGTKTPTGASTGLDHIKELGVTHVHLLPAFDFKSIDESKLEANIYNWGYDPQNFNIPEGSYSTNPSDGQVRIREFRQMVKSLHDNGLRVVLDVVYNHTGDTEGSVFNAIFPGYYYRQSETGGYSNASGCGNETASERTMMRKYMVESMLFWAKEYHIDGFRVDLMGIHDIETMNLIASELRKVDPTIFIYGEGWTSGGSPLPESKRAVKSNTPKLDGIAAFSDDFRDGVKGHVFKPMAAGFITGEDNLEESVKFGIVGATQHPQVKYDLVNYSKAPWAKAPAQCINYVSCHDNHTLWDRLVNSSNKSTEENLLLLDKFAQTVVFTSQGIPFLHAGEEFVRTKKGVENSFESPDEFNQINWDNKEKYKDLFEYYKALIRLRKNHPAFRMESADMIAKHLQFLDFPYDNMVGYMINDHANGDKWKRIMVIFNGNKIGKQITIPEGNWKRICYNGQIDENGMGDVSGGVTPMLPSSALILAEFK